MLAKVDTTKATKKPAAKAKAKAAPVSKGDGEDKNVVTLKALCADLKIEPYDARVKLRAAVASKEYPELAKAHKAKASWSWDKGSAALKEARAVLTAK
jgi:hypothetical protein